ncbi:MAG: S24/S26 family peptidase [Tenericutes bacterium]|nr:S24/S26 family peptidase [Mycoplasmatota bacterium]
MNRSIKVSIQDLLPTINNGLNNNQLVELKVFGTSMKPFLKDQESTVILKKYSGTLKKYHIYFYHIGDKYILHRFLKTKNNKNYFRGDALNGYELVRNEDVLAEVVAYKEVSNNKNLYSFINMFTLRCYLMYKGMKNLVKRIIRG